ncbi:MAG: PAS domain S-box protein [Candidatus Aminicenantes bacterium]|nr:PAS domain S-box protein [Candidatus Aminicenantes bacterium]
MRKKFIPLIFLFAASFSFVLQAQNENPEITLSFSHLSLESGLSQASVFVIIQDRYGFIWAATEDGLNRYNGYEFDTFYAGPNNPQGLSDGYLLCLCEDHLGVIWMGTRGGGLNAFDPLNQTFQTFQNDPENPESLSPGRVNCVFEDSSGTLWVGTEQGLNRYNREKQNFTCFQQDREDSQSLSNNLISYIYERPSQPGILWVGTRGGGLNRLEIKNNVFKRYLHDSSNPRSLSDDKVSCLYEAPSMPGILWVGTDGGGLNSFNPEADKPVFARFGYEPENPRSLSHNFVTCIYEDTSGKFWICTGGGGLNRMIFGDKRGNDSSYFIHYRKNYNDPQSIASDFVFSVIEDRSGILWFGTFGEGISKLDPKKPHFVTFDNNPLDENSLSNNGVRAVYEDKSGVLWVGTFGGGLNKINRRTGKYTHYQNDPRDSRSLSHDRVFSIYEDQRGVLWIGTEAGGLNKLNRDTGRFTRYHSSPDSSSENRVNTMLEDRNGAFWVGTRYEGLYVFDRSKETFTRNYVMDPESPDSLRSNDIYFLYEDNAGFLWVCTFGGGLSRYDRHEDKFIHYTHNPQDAGSISSNNVLTILEDLNGAFWIGTYGGGLNRFIREENRFNHLSEEDGMPSSVVYGILEDSQGNLWLSTNKGLSRYSQAAGRFKNYDVRDGLQSNEFNGGAYFKNTKGEMFFGGVLGLNAFFPESIGENPFVPPVVITDFQLNNKSVPVGEMEGGRTILEQSIRETEKLVLSYRDRVFSFEFAALSYTSPEKNQYAYIMHGLDDEWNMAGNRRFVSYAAVRPGNYVFQVKAANNDGVWNEEGVSLAIRIKPPFWRTKWFQGLAAVAVLLSFFAVYQIRVHNMRERNIQLNQMVMERTQQLQKANEELGKLSLVARETDNAVIIMDAQGNFEWVNDGFIRFYNMTMEEMIQKRGKNILDASENESIKNILQKCITNKQSFIYETPVSKTGGKKRWMQTTLTPILDEEGNINKLVAIDSDITRIKAAEEQIFAQKEKLEMINNELKDFAYIISHDLKAPLRAVSQLADWISEDYRDALDKEGQEKMDTLIGRVSRMEKLIDGVLQYSRAGRVMGEIEEINLDELVSRVIENLSPPKNIWIHVNSPLPHIKAHSVKIEQVFQNLIGNAVKYMDKEEGEIKIDWADEGQFLMFVVSDNGPGIEEQYHQEIFKIFQTLEARDTRESTGVGLSVVKKIVEQHGGHIWVESKVGKGSSFNFTIKKEIQDEK